MPPSRIVLPETREAILKELPFLEDAPEWWPWVEYMLFHFNNADENGIVLDYQTVGRLIGKSKAALQGNLTAEDYIQEFARLLEEANPFFEPQVLEHNKKHGQARVLQNLLTPRLAEARMKELEARQQERQHRGVWLDTGKANPGSKSKESLNRKAHRETALQGAAAALPAHQELLEYLNGQPSRMFNQQVQQHIEAARQLALELKGPQRDQVLSQLHTIEMYPQPFYGPSRKGHTDRVFPIGVTYLGLPRRIRSRLLQGCTAFDIQSAQLAIIAHYLDLKTVQETLRQVNLQIPTGSIWEKMAHDLKVDVQVYKPLFKEVMYSAVFGRSKKNLKTLLERGGNPDSADAGPASNPQGLGTEKARQFMHLPYIQELLDGRDRKLDDIKQAGGVSMPNGTFVPLNKERSARSLFAQLMQTHELLLLQPIIAYLKKHDKIRVMAWLHDGFVLHFTDRTHAERYTDVIEHIFTKTVHAELRPLMSRLVSEVL